MTRIEKTTIRECFGHNNVDCKVRIRDNGDVERYCLPDTFNRKNGVWTIVSTVEMERHYGCLKDLAQ